MEPKTLIPGIVFAIEHNLSGKEMEVLNYFLKGNLTTAQLAEAMKVPKTTLHHTIQRLKLKGLLRLEDKDKEGNMIYTFALTSAE